MSFVEPRRTMAIRPSGPRPFPPASLAELDVRLADHGGVALGVLGDRVGDLLHAQGLHRFQRLPGELLLDLGVGDHVQFDDRFLSIEELADLLAATDVFVTPYTNSGLENVRNTSVRRYRSSSVLIRSILPPTSPHT